MIWNLTYDANILGEHGWNVIDAAARIYETSASIMKPGALIASIAQKGADQEAIASKLIRIRADLAPLLDGMNSHTAAVKFGCEKVLQVISEKDPALVYPYFDRIAAFLDSDNTILKWGAIQILSNLATVDENRLLVALFDRYFHPISGPEMIAAANIIAGSPKIARAYPELADRIKDQILKVQKARYKTSECRNVAIGHALTALAGFYDLITETQTVLAFVRKQCQNPRNSVAVKARKLLNSLSAGPGPGTKTIRALHSSQRT